MQKVIRDVLNAHQKALACIEQQRAQVEAIGRLLVTALKNKNKIIFCGNGGSAADSQHLAAEFVGRFKDDNIILPAMALSVNTSLITAIANDFGFARIFSRQIQAVAQPGDVLVAISTSGNSENVVGAVRQAKKQGVKTVGFLGGDGGVLRNETDLCFIASECGAARAQEIHILIGHILCEIVDEAFKDEKRA